MAQTSNHVDPHPRPLHPGLLNPSGRGVALLIARDVNCRLAVLATLNQLGYRTLPRRAASDLARIERIYQPNVVVADARALSCPAPNLSSLRALSLRVPLIVVRPPAADGLPLPAWAARRAVRLGDLTDLLLELVLRHEPGSSGARALSAPVA